METDVLIVEDESIVALDLDNRLTSMGFHVVARAGTGATALEIVEQTPPEVVLMDIQLRGDIDGIKTADLIQETYDVPGIFLTAFSDSRSLDRAKRSNAYGYLLKPFQERELSIAIELALYKHGAERGLRENRVLLGVTLNSVTEGIVTADRSDRILFMNRAAEHLTGWSASEAIGSDIASVVRTDVEFAESFSSQEWARLTPRNGEPRKVAISSNSLDPQSRGGGSRVVVIRDVTQEQEYRDSLVAAKEAAESAAQAKSDFLARVTHELRTPLNSILGMTSLLKDEPDARSAREYLEILDLSSQQLMGLISDILDYARFDSGRLSLQRELFDPVVAAERVCRSLAVEAGRKGLRMVTVIEPSTIRGVYGDETRFGQILRNIISNAVKFTTAGHIVVTLQPGTGRMLSVLVEDTGPGVASEHQALIFEDFSQIESPTTRKAGGVGLGLALVRRLVDAMEGSLELRDSSTGGSTFAVELPFAAAPGDSSDAINASPLIRSVATDDDLIARSWKPWCEAAGITLSRVPAGELRAASTNYDLVITTDQDAANMPDVESVLVVRGVRGQPGGPGSHGRRGKTVFEPVSIETIHDSIYGTRPEVESNGEPSNVEQSNVVRETPAVEVPLKLLVVDDDRSNLVLHRKLLEGHGHHVVTAVGGTEALEALQDGDFDVAVLDIAMPDMDGWELAGRIRSGAGGESVKTLPLVALSGHAARDISHRAAEVGFDGVLTKPVHVETMNRMLLEAAGGRDLNRPERLGVPQIREAIESGNDQQAQQMLTEMRWKSPRTGIAETAFRLLLALRRKDRNTVQRLVAELEKETDVWDQNRTSAS